MTDRATKSGPMETEHMLWVQTRMRLDQELTEWVRHGFSLIAIGFGSFAFLEGVIQSAGEGMHFTSPSRVFSLVANAIGVIAVLFAVFHHRKMTAWVNADEFRGEAPDLPDEMLPYRFAGLALVVGVVSFIGLLFIQ